MAATDMELGPCSVIFNDVNLGGTLEAKIALTTVFADLSADQYGSEFYDKVVTGMGAIVTCNLTDITLANLAKALNQTLRTDGSDSAIAGTNLIGTKLSSKAYTLILKKYVDGSASADENDWFTFRKAAILSEELELTFDAETQRVASISFAAFWDNENGYLYIIGKEAIAS